jgi:type IV secretion system protein TrbD
MGGDRELVLVSLLTSVALAFSLASWWGLAVSVAWYVGAMAILKRMGKADPLLRQVYMRHIRYRPFYPAKSGLYSRCLQPPMTWR